MADDEGPRAKETIAEGAVRSFSFGELVSTIRITAVALVWVVVAYFLIYYALTGGIRRLISAIEVTHVEAFGVKVNIDQRTAALRERLNQDADGSGSAKSAFALNMDLLVAAISRAEANAATVRGSRILWVDDEPANNTAVIDLLSQLGISVVAVTNNEEALRLIGGSRFDLVVTDGARPSDRDRPQGAVLSRCPLRYRAVPSGGGAVSVEEANARVSRGLLIPGGFRLVEAIAEREAERAAAVVDPEEWSRLDFYGERPLYADITAPRIIMYSASNGDISYNPCIRSITRRTDYLFNAIVSVLEETREPVGSVSAAAGTPSPEAG